MTGVVAAPSDFHKKVKIEIDDTALTSVSFRAVDNLVDVRYKTHQAEELRFAA